MDLLAKYHVDYDKRRSYKLMNYTTNYGLRKPQRLPNPDNIEDIADIEDINFNSDKLDSQLKTTQLQNDSNTNEIGRLNTRLTSVEGNRVKVTSLNASTSINTLTNDGEYFGLLTDTPDTLTQGHVKTVRTSTGTSITQAYRASGAYIFWNRYAVYSAPSSSWIWGTWQRSDVIYDAGQFDIKYDTTIGNVSNGTLNGYVTRGKIKDSVKINGSLSPYNAVPSPFLGFKLLSDLFPFINVPINGTLYHPTAGICIISGIISNYTTDVFIVKKYDNSALNIIPNYKLHFEMFCEIPGTL